MNIEKFPSTPWLPAREHDLKEPARRFLEARGFEVLEEVSIFGRIQDLVGYERRTGALIVVELKLDKWQQALQQCNGPRVWSDEVYVGLPTARSHRALRYRERFERAGVGIVEIAEQSARIALESARSSPPALATRRAAIAYFSGGEGV